MKQNRIFITLMLLCAAVSESRGENHVLSLDGHGDYVRILNAPELQGGKNVVKTIEAWFMPKEMSFPVVGKTLDGNAKDWAINLNEEFGIHFHSASGGSDYRPSAPSGLILMNQWYHVAVVINRPERLLRLYLNGALVAEDVNMGNESAETGAPVEIGAYSYMPSFAFGYIDEVRIWNVARTEEQIRETMLTSLHGDEPGLVGYWQFEGEGQKVLDASPNEHHGEMLGDAKRIVIELPNRVQSVPKPARISGVVSDDKGKPIPNAIVRLEQVERSEIPSIGDEVEIASATTNAKGNYRMSIYPVRGLYDLSATSGNLGDWRLGIRLSEGERRTLNFTLKEAISIEGTLLMLDDVTPHVAVPVQAICNGKVIATTLSDESGKYRFINLKPGQYQLRCQVLGGYVYYRVTEHALRFTPYDSQVTESVIAEDVADVLQVEDRKTLKNIDFRFAPFKKGTWKNYDTMDGLAHNAVGQICRASDGVMWFGTEGGGVSRYDGKEFVNFTTEDGLASSWVFAIHRDPDGIMWFGTEYGVSRYDGKSFVNFTTKDGLAHNWVSAIYRDPDGVMWFGTYSDGISRYDGKEFVNFTTKDGLANNGVLSICHSPDGAVWFGTEGGVSRYGFDTQATQPKDGKEFINFTTKDGLAHNAVSTIHCDPDGVLWFGTRGGVSRYDGEEFVNLTTKDGLVHNIVFAIHRDPDGVMWFGTRGGVSRYDGKGFVNFTRITANSATDGLANNLVKAIHRDPDGVLWFGTGAYSWTERGSVSRFDAKTFVNFTTKDGLLHNFVYVIHRDPDGMMWFGTCGGGVSRYDGKEFINFTTKDGLADNWVCAIYRAPDGIMWFGTRFSGVSRYDGKEFINFTTRDGLPHNDVLAIHRDPDGVMWFGTLGGVSRYDGEEFVNFTTEDGLASNWVFAIHRDPNGVMWFGTGGGVSRYDGKEFVNLTTKDGLAHIQVSSIYCAPDGMVWFGTHGGVSRYDGKEFINFTTKDGLAHNSVWHIHSDPDGVMWFGTDGGGVSCYDGAAWTSLDIRDGLAGKTVSSIHRDSDGALWFATDGGITRYRRSNVPPKVNIVSVTTDQTYLDISAVPASTPGTRVTVEYNAIDFVTVPEKRQYRCRIKEIDSDWRKPTKSASFDYTFKKAGTYTFEVQAIDRDLNYSQPASVTLKVVPPWYLNGWIAFPSGGAILALLIGFIVFGSRYYVQRRESQQLREQMLQQEREAHETLQAQNIQLQEAKESAEVAREEAETANQAKSIFLANMSHEIRTPMNAVLGYAQILQRTPDLQSEVRSAVETIENSGNHLLALINDVLDISKIEAGRLQLQDTDFDLNALIDGVSAMFQMRCEREGLTWRVEGIDEDRSFGFAQDMVLVHGDEGKLRQVLINLLGNAVKFTESGEVTLNVASEADSPLLQGEGPGVRYRFEVRDTGVGIPPEAQEKIFEPFQQSEEGAKKGGTGLGLAISKKQIELMGGELSLESEVGVGSSFFFTLPLSPSPPRATATDDTTSDVIDQSSQYIGVTRLAEGYNIKALIADDTKVNRDVLSRMLTDIGVEVMEAENGQQAVEMFRENQPNIVF
ncbi:carboxypeptidase regulatory-like domain-containing protein, partial [bacterium]|nr:carboxypeptidase regulatory-like domain-containing protein [bacterium]